MEHLISIDPDTDLWVAERGDPSAPAVLLVMGANASGIVWPDGLVDRLARRYRVVRYDHRDTGRSTRAFDLAGTIEAHIDPVDRAAARGRDLG